ncbi:hypothetical protein N7475_007455 [Penicillium sp. IBT 31633x]|nr:hypothetical protein N7475_007455 [Penicillium sp. IBT 31633x]
MSLKLLTRSGLRSQSRSIPRCYEYKCYGRGDIRGITVSAGEEGIIVGSVVALTLDDMVFV